MLYRYLRVTRKDMYAITTKHIYHKYIAQHNAVVRYIIKQLLLLYIYCYSYSTLVI